MNIEKLIEQLNEYAQSYTVHDDPDLIDTLKNSAIAFSMHQIENQALRNSVNELQAENEKLRAELNKCREKNAGLALALLFECVPNPDVAEKPAIEDILKVVFQPGYDVVTIYNPPDEDGLYTMTVTGVISKEEYEAALKAREQDEQ